MREKNTKARTKHSCTKLATTTPNTNKAKESERRRRRQRQSLCRQLRLRITFFMSFQRIYETSCQQQQEQQRQQLETCQTRFVFVVVSRTAKSIQIILVDTLCLALTAHTKRNLSLPANIFNLEKIYLAYTLAYVHIYIYLYLKCIFFYEPKGQQLLHVRALALACWLAVSTQLLSAALIELVWQGKNRNRNRRTAEATEKGTHARRKGQSAKRILPYIALTGLPL